jgi:hypothetical protein
MVAPKAGATEDLSNYEANYLFMNALVQECTGEDLNYAKVGASHPEISRSKSERGAELKVLEQIGEVCEFQEILPFGRLVYNLML